MRQSKSTNGQRTAVILAGGLGSRLRPLTEAIPKPLLPVGEKAMLEIQIAGLKTFGFTDIILATNYKSEYIESYFGNGSRWGVDITVSKEEKPLGTCGPLSLIRDRLRDPFIVMNGDILTNINFEKAYQFALTQECGLTVVTHEVVMPFAFGNVFSNGNRLIGVEEKPNIKTEIIAGIYVFKPEAVDLVPDDEYFGMDTLIKKMLAEDRPIARYLMTELWLDIGQREDYDRAQTLYREHFDD